MLDLKSGSGLGFRVSLVLRRQLACSPTYSFTLACLLEGLAVGCIQDMHLTLDSSGSRWMM